MSVVVFLSREYLRLFLGDLMLVLRIFQIFLEGVQWLSARVLDSRPNGSGFEPHRCHCIVVIEQDTFILA